MGQFEGRIIYVWSDVKNIILKETRGITFEEVIKAIEKGDLIDDIKHFNSDKYGDQHIYCVNINNYIYYIPHRKTRNGVALITIIPSRKLTKIYLNDQDSNDKKDS